ncbi:MAG: hypothetical protein Q4B03_04175 [Lachnospiraceae bacterium]|nr:hypothetical protein [Lachnospiraceae bacterium]
MNQEELTRIRDDLLRKLKELGADLAGAASVDALRNGPSEQLFPNMKDHTRDHFAGEITTGLPHGQVFWEEDAEAVLVFAVAHPKDQPQLDWWCGEIDPPGNKRLLAISKGLRAYIKELYPGVHLYSKRYHVERGGVYLKEAAVQAGLGCIGYNNLLVTPEYGPRVRLRAMTISLPLPATGPIDYDPCASCEKTCIRSCPMHSFDEVIYTKEETGLEHLPGRNGRYYRAACNQMMLYNEEHAKEGLMPEVCDHPEKIIKYCRGCELNCIAGADR